MVLTLMGWRQSSEKYDYINGVDQKRRRRKKRTHHHSLNHHQLRLSILTWIDVAMKWNIRRCDCSFKLLRLRERENRSSVSKLFPSDDPSERASFISPSLYLRTQWTVWKERLMLKTDQRVEWIVLRVRLSTGRWKLSGRIVRLPLSEKEIGWQLRTWMTVRDDEQSYVLRSTLTNTADLSTLYASKEIFSHDLMFISMTWIIEKKDQILMWNALHE